MPRHKFHELKAKMSPESLERAQRKAEVMLTAMALDELRRRRHVTQEELAARLGRSQPHVSQLERRMDMHVSTLRDVIKALGGKLHLWAQFPEGEMVQLSQFEEPGGRG